MMQNVIIGQYVPAESPIHRMDPRSKLISVFIFVLIVFLANNWVSYGFLGVFTVGSAVLSRVPISYLIKGMKPILWIVLFTVLLHLIMTKEGPVLVDLFLFKIHEGGLIKGIFIALRLFFLILLTSLLTLTTTPIDITDGLEDLLGPLKRLKFPVHEFALMMSISLRFIPTLLQETEKIMKAQSARGAEFTSGPIKERIKAFVPLLIPLFISAFKRAEDLALAMEARGYRGGEGRTKLRLLRWKFRDTLGLLSMGVLILALVLVRS
ncbi:energy-coupling factor transporter transmembrane protein EcfT [Alkalihalobacillus sp. AL-G]|uniref:energy-coupling factor transporter transmembrane component T family protein n=1 Tax=Alkalihalobacillus sp. AL-G TaxID=2926399 RepID=UPI00272C5243|nr:energy-coupling factor transporter transmembrane protein EcfT [Alkalihalobacillus sp. AL-G]WLD93559.1 energy-coupling factor transporter transmembrane protein EcfT [Alkalihalobacillus sp. AL-G]